MIFFSEINTVIRVYNKTFVFWARYISFSIWILVCLLELTSADHHAFEAVRSALPSLSHSMRWKQCVPFLSLRLSGERRPAVPHTRPQGMEGPFLSPSDHHSSDFIILVTSICQSPGGVGTWSWWSCYYLAPNCIAFHCGEPRGPLGPSRGREVASAHPVLFTNGVAQI